MKTAFYDEIREQPNALNALIEAYSLENNQKRLRLQQSCC